MAGTRRPRWWTTSSRTEGTSVCSGTGATGDRCASAATTRKPAGKIPDRLIVIKLINRAFQKRAWPEYDLRP